MELMDSSESDDDHAESNISVTIASLLCEEEGQKIDNRVKKTVDVRATYGIRPQAVSGISFPAPTFLSKMFTQENFRKFSQRSTAAH